MRLQLIYGACPVKAEVVDGLFRATVGETVKQVVELLFSTG